MLKSQRAMLTAFSLVLLTLHLSTAVISAQPEQKAELVVQTGHSTSIESFVFSPNKKLFATSGDKVIKLWDVETGLLLRTLKGHIDEINNIAFSPNGKKLASVGQDRTIRLWDIETGTQMHVLKGSESYITSVAFSPDGKFIASCGYDKNNVKLWDVETGKLIHTFESYWSETVVFSPNGEILASIDRSGTINFWNTETYQLLSSIERNNTWLNSIAFSPDGKFIVSQGISDKLNQLSKEEKERGEDHKIGIWKVQTGESIKAFNGEALWGNSINQISNKKVVVLKPESDYKNNIYKIELWELEIAKQTNSIWFVAYLPKGEMIAVDGNNPTENLKIEKKQLLKSFESHSESINTVIFSSNFETLMFGKGYDAGKMWNTKTGQVQPLKPTDLASHLINLQFLPNYLRRINLSSSGQMIAHTNFSPKIEITDSKTGKPLFTLRSKNIGPIATATFSPDGENLASANEKGEVKIWDIKTRRIILSLKEKISMVMNALVFSADGKILVGTGNSGPIKLWNTETGKLLQSLEGHKGPTFAIAFSPDGKTIASGSWDNTIRLWDIASGKELKILNGHTSNVNSVLFSQSGSFLFSASSDTTIKIWGVDNADLIASLIPLDENEWAVITPEGLFDASPGARKLMHYVIGLEPIALEQMKDLYYVPGLLQKILKGEPLPKVELFSKKDLFPTVEYEPLTPNQNQLKVKLTNRGGGIGQVQVLFNGKELINDARPPGFNPGSLNVTLTVDLSKASIKPGEKNKIEIIARNASGSLSTRGTKGSEVVFLDSGKKQTETPNIFAIVGGVSDYTGNGLDLNFAAKDAEDFAKAIEIGAVKLLGDKSKVHIRLLTGSREQSKVKFDVPDAKISKAAKTDFERAFADFKNATPNDVFIVYLSGHGVSLKRNQDKINGDLYLYLTQEATKNDMSDEIVRKAMAISSDELKDLMKQNKALKQVLILDTCAAGQAAASFVQKKDLPDDDARIKAIERLKDNTGFYVLMGSSADAVSYEASQYGQGLLTYSLLQGMKGAKLSDNNALVADLFNYAQEKVPEMAKNIGGIQRPLVITPDLSGNFPIGKFTADEQKLIVLPNPKPLLLNPKLLDKKQLNDNLKLTQLLKMGLREKSYSGSVRGTLSSPLIFVEADEMTDAISPSGLYSVDEGQLTINVVLYRNETQVGKEITVSGEVSKKEEVIKELISKIINMVK